MNSPSASQVTVVKNSSHMCACTAILAAATIQRPTFISLRAFDCAATTESSKEIQHSWDLKTLPLYKMAELPHSHTTWEWNSGYKIQ